MDHDKDGVIGKNDLRATFDNVGRLVTDKELDEMLNEAPAPINFTQLLNLFATRMSGSGNDICSHGTIVTAINFVNARVLNNSQISRFRCIFDFGNALFG